MLLFNTVIVDIIKVKDNINLEKSMITGILRVAKESIFSGLNNLEVYSLLGEKYSDKFGFTEDEIVTLLRYYNMDDNLDSFKKWYNGYIFEFKRYDEEDEETIEETLNEALQQIEDKKYDTELIKRGVKSIVNMAIVFNGKNVHIKRN